LLIGAVETSRLLIRAFLGLSEPAEFSRTVVWLAPTGSIVVLGLIGVGVGALGRLSRGIITVRLVVGLLGTLSIFTMLRLLLPSVHPVAAALLAGGASVRIAAVVSHRPAGFLKIVRASTILGLASVVGLAAGVTAWTHWEESRKAGGLPTADESSPNVLLLVLDAVRSLNLSVYGYERGTTPSLQAFAASGVVFERASSTSSWSLPSHASLVTGRYPHELSTGWDQPLDDTYPTLAEILAGQGYATAAFMANEFFGARYWGLDRGFAHYDVRPVSLASLVGSSWLARRTLRPVIKLIAPQRIDRLNAADMNGRLLAWLDRREDRPFFAMVNYMDGHDPYLPPPPYDRVFRNDPPGDELRPDGYEYTRSEIADLIDAYDTGIAYLDRQLGALFENLDARSLLSKTIVIITADHGEAFAENDPRMVGHGVSLYYPVLAVPLIMVHPATVPAGLRIKQPVSIRDIPVTVERLLQASGASRLPGVPLSDLWQPLRDGTGAAERTRLSELEPNVWTTLTWQPVQRGPMKAVFADSLHYILNGDGLEELYNVDRDPLERSDLSTTDLGSRVLPGFRSALQAMLEPDRRD
jgi:arylsulfatase A-like enzyme